MYRFQSKNQFLSQTIIMLLPNVPHYTTSSMCESKYETTSFYFTAYKHMLSG